MDVEEWIRKETEEHGPMNHGEDEFARFVWPVAFEAGRREGMEEAARIAEVLHEYRSSDFVDAGDEIAKAIRSSGQDTGNEPDK